MDIKKFLGWCIKGIKLKIRRMSREQKRWVIFGIIALLIGAILGNSIGRAKEEKKSFTEKMKDGIKDLFD